MADPSGFVFSAYYFGNLAHTYALKQPWVKTGMILKGAETDSHKEIEECLRGMVSAPDGETLLLGGALRERVGSGSVGETSKSRRDDLGALCEALVLRSRAEFFTTKALYWNIESVEMFLTWNDDWLEETLGKWDSPRKAPPTQIERVAGVIESSEEDAAEFLLAARTYRVLYNKMRALGADYAHCKLTKEVVKRKESGFSATRRETKRRQGVAKVELKRAQNALTFLNREAKNRWTEPLGLVAKSALSDYDADIKAIAEKLGIEDYQIRDLRLASDSLYSSLHQQWVRAVHVTWVHPVKRLRELPGKRLIVGTVLPGALLSKEVGDVIYGRKRFSWRRMVDQEQLNAFGDGYRRSAIPTEVMESVFSGYLVRLLVQVLDKEVSVLERRVSSLEERVSVVEAELAKFATKELVVGYTKAAVQSLDKSIKERLDEAVPLRTTERELRQLDTLIGHLRIASSAKGAEGQDAGEGPPLPSIVEALERARAAAVSASKSSEAVSALNARAEQAKSEAVSASDARAEQAGKRNAQRLQKPASASDARAEQAVSAPKSGAQRLQKPASASDARAEQAGKRNAQRLQKPASASDARAEQAELEREREKLELWTPPGMVLIPGGAFRSDRDGGVVGTVHVDDFYIDTHPVTFADFKKFLDKNPEWQRHNRPHGDDSHYLNWADSSEPPKRWLSEPPERWLNAHPVGEADCPVTHVSLEAAMAYAAWAGKRLPTEDEWEKAARGGLVNKAYPWGNTITVVDTREIDDEGRSADGEIIIVDAQNRHWNAGLLGYGGVTAPVGSFPPNGYGLYDVVGLVWEWCADPPLADFVRGKPPRSGRVRGGGMDFVRGIGTSKARPESLRTAGQSASLDKSYLLGFRCVKDVAR